MYLNVSIWVYSFPLFCFRNEKFTQIKKKLNFLHCHCSTRHSLDSVCILSTIASHNMQFSYKQKLSSEDYLWSCLPTSDFLPSLTVCVLHSRPNLYVLSPNFSRIRVCINARFVYLWLYYCLAYIFLRVAKEKKQVFRV